MIFMAVLSGLASINLGILFILDAAFFKRDLDRPVRAVVASILELSVCLITAWHALSVTINQILHSGALRQIPGHWLLSLLSLLVLVGLTVFMVLCAILRLRRGPHWGAAKVIVGIAGIVVAAGLNIAPLLWI